MTHTKISMTEAAAGLLGEYGTSASDAVVYAMTHRVPVEADTVFSALDATDGRVLAECVSEGWHYLIKIDGETAAVCRTSKDKASTHDRDSPYVRSLLDSYKVVLVSAADYDYTDL
jgi:hypothetical protein